MAFSGILQIIGNHKPGDLHSDVFPLEVKCPLIAYCQTVWNFPCGRSQGAGKRDVQADTRPGLKGHGIAGEAGMRHQAPGPIAWGSDVYRTRSSVGLDDHADPGAAFCVILSSNVVRCYLPRYLSEVLAIEFMD